MKKSKKKLTLMPALMIGLNEQETFALHGLRVVLQLHGYDTTTEFFIVPITSSPRVIVFVFSPYFSQCISNSTVKTVIGVFDCLFAVRGSVILGQGCGF